MDFTDVLKRRRSIRSYLPDSIPAEAAAKIKEAVELAPTACNLQPFKVFFITNDALRKKICGIYKAGWLGEAPAIAVVAGNYGECWKRLEAANLGLGTCWICAFRRAEMDEILGLKQPWRSVAMTPVGFPAKQPAPRSGKPASELFEVIG